MKMNGRESKHLFNDKSTESLWPQWTSMRFVSIRGEPRGRSTTHDGRLVVACGRPGAVRIFDCSDGRPTRVIEVAGVDWPNQAIVIAAADPRFRPRQDAHVGGASSVGDVDDDDDGGKEMLVICHGEGWLTTKERTERSVVDRSIGIKESQR
jgi:hypothetical protein